MSLMLAETIEKIGQDPKGWLMSEKLDGVRCFWNGTTMYTRNGNTFYPPDWFKKELPANLALDGELWTKRDDFQNTVRIVRKQDKNERWKEVTYMVYDAPLLTTKFKERLETIKKVLA
jgi:DNA ligase 1